MPRAKAKSAAGPVLLVCGEEDFAVKARAREVHDQWCAEIGGMDHETVDGLALNAAEAQKAVARLLEALNTLPFFGGGKVVWLKDCSFLGDDRTAGSKTVTDDLAALSKVLKDFQWGDVRLLISAGKVDKRKTFYKTVSKIGEVETFAGLSVDDKDWADKAETIAWRHFKDAGKEPVGDALAQLVASVGPHAAQLASEVEKVCLYVGENPQVTVDDVDAVVIRNKQAKAFALGDALGDRDLPRLLRTLDGELWEMQFDKKKSEIGMLYGLISKVRVMLFLKEMIHAGLLRDESNYARFKAALERVPADRLPADRRINPLAMNPYVLFRALPQSRRYTRDELVRAMDLLLQCNRRLVSSATQGALVMQQTLTEILRRDTTAAGRRH